MASTDECSSKSQLKKNETAVDFVKPESCVFFAKLNGTQFLPTAHP